MGRKRIEGEDKRISINIRLPSWIVEKLREKGNITAIIEDAVKKYLNLEKRD